MNNKPFGYLSSWGTEFSSETCDFRKSVKVKKSWAKDDQRYSKDLAEMIGYHATNIWPELNGFQGYDTIKFEFID